MIMFVIVDPKVLNWYYHKCILRAKRNNLVKIQETLDSNMSKNFAAVFVRAALEMLKKSIGGEKSKWSENVRQSAKLHVFPDFERK